MPHVTFGENDRPRRSYDESRTLTRIPDKREDDRIGIIRQRSRTISYKIPEEKTLTPKPCHPVKPADKFCIERKVTYRDLCGNIVKITYEDSCGHVTKTIYPAPQPKCSPPPAPFPPPISEPSNIPSEDARNCNWTKIVVKNSRGVVWKVVHVDCDGKTMKTEYPEPEAPRRRSIETKRYVIKELDDVPNRRRLSETKKVVIRKDSHDPVPRRLSETKTTEKEVVELKSALKVTEEPQFTIKVSAKESDVQSAAKSASDTTTTTATRRDSGTSVSDKRPTESEREVVKDANGVTRRVTYTDSRGRRRTVMYDD